MVKVSVIVPTYNREKYLVQALKDLKAQTLKDIEFIIVDDGSQDNTSDVLKKEIGKDKRFQVISYKENKGPSHARNQALEHVQGEFIGFFDIDDHIPADYYEILYKNAVDHGVDLCIARAGRSPNDLRDKIELLRQGSIWDKIYARNLIIGHNLKFEEGLFTADTLFTLQAIYYAKNVYTSTQTKYEYTLKKDSIGAAKSYSSKRKDDIFVIIGKMQEFAESHEFSPKDKEALNAFIKRCFKASPYGKNFQKKLSCMLGEKEEKPSKTELFCLRLQKVLHLISTKTYKERRAVMVFKASSLFDQQWYLLHYPEARNSEFAPELHYYKIGWKKGFNPSEKFDGNAYLDEHTDVKNMGKNPLEHYLLSGQYEGRYYVAVGNKSTEHPIEEPLFPQKTPRKLGAKIRYALEYPIRVKEEYDRLVAEIKALENLK
ncbi:MAG: glycosyltransferase family 2 protein [Alphaproteobacteria bacterium]|nr:glycosyltransferase family 2 protein [Alphaproteobacteria bacterium]